MFNELYLGKVSPFRSGQPDKNGKDPVIIEVIAGKCPNRTVLSGTVAENAGLCIGKTYLMQVREVEEDTTYGRQFVHTPLKELDAMEILDARIKLGPAVIINASSDIDDEGAYEGVKAKAGNSFERLNS